MQHILLSGYKWSETALSLTSGVQFTVLLELCQIHVKAMSFHTWRPSVQRPGVPSPIPPTLPDDLVGTT